VYATQTEYVNPASFETEIARGTKGQNIIINLSAKMMLDWGVDVPGDYNIDLSFDIKKN